MIALLWMGASLAAAPEARPAVEVAVATELDRAMTGLRLPGSTTPYLVQYDVLDGEVASYFAELGAPVSEDVEHLRNLRVEVRVGSYQRDSSNFSAFGEPGGVVTRVLPDEDDVIALRREIWLATDDAYKGAVGQMSRKDARLSNDPTSRPPDYEQRPPVSIAVDQTDAAAHPLDAAGLRERVLAASGWLRGYPGIEVGQAIGRDWQGRRLLVSSEGTHLWRDTGYAVVRVEGTLRMVDGVELRDSRSWIAPTVKDLPALPAMEAATRAMADRLVVLAGAPAIEDYLGPVVFEGSGAVEFFSQLLAGEIVGTPGELSADEDSAVSRGGAVRLGRRLLPEGWSVVDDSTQVGRCMGAYAYDHEGVPPRVVEVIRDGVLRDVLMSRVPSLERPTSTGHGRAVGADRRGAMPGCVSVTPQRLVSTHKLERRALRLAGQTGRDFVLVVGALEPPSLSPGLDITFTGEAPLPGLTHPYEVYRLYTDGRREVVRAGDFVGVDRRVLRDIVAATAGPGPVDMLDGPPGPGRFQVGNSGGLAVTWDVPAILVSELELTAPKPGREPRVIKAP